MNIKRRDFLASASRTISSNNPREQQTLEQHHVKFYYCDAIWATFVTSTVCEFASTVCESTSRRMCYIIHCMQIFVDKKSQRHFLTKSLLKSRILY